MTYITPYLIDQYGYRGFTILLVRDLDIKSSRMILALQIYIKQKMFHSRCHIVGRGYLFTMGSIWLFPPDRLEICDALGLCESDTSLTPVSAVVHTRQSY